MQPLKQVTSIYAESILPFHEEMAHVWGRLRVPNPENPLDKRIAATALIHCLTVVIRNTDHFAPSGARLLNPLGSRAALIRRNEDSCIRICENAYPFLFRTL
jgi:toxin FitB